MNIKISERGELLITTDTIDCGAWRDPSTGRVTMWCGCETHPLRRWKDARLRAKIDRKHSGVGLRKGSFEWHRKRDVAKAVAVASAYFS